MDAAVWQVLGGMAAGIVTVTVAMVALFKLTVGKTLAMQGQQGTQLAASIDKLSTTVSTEMTAVRTEISGMKDRLGEQLSDIRVDIAATKSATEAMASRLESLTDPKPPRAHLASVRRRNGNED